MQIEVSAKMDNLCQPVRAFCESNGYSHLMILNACNSHLGKMKIAKQGESKTGDGKYNAKKDTFKVSVKPGTVQFTTTADVCGQFIAWHDAVKKAHAIATMDTVNIPEQFKSWLKFAHKEVQPVAA